MGPALGMQGVKLLKTRLPFVLNPEDSCASSAGGWPLIPVSSAGELELLKKAAHLHDTELVPDEDWEPDHATGLPPKRAGTVIALGVCALEASRLYAHLTGRTFAGVWADRPDPSMVAVAVGIAADLTLEIIEQLNSAAGRMGQMGGLILAPTAELLRTAVKRFAVATCSSPIFSRRALMLPSEPFRQVARPEGLFVGGDIEPDALRDVISAGHSILSIATHSGVSCFKVASSRRLCPLEGPAAVLAARGHICADLGQCTELPGLPSLPKTGHAEQLLPFNELSAQILVLASCNIVRVEANSEEKDIGIGGYLCALSNIGACITTWRPDAVSRDGASIYHLLNSLTEGRPVGKAVAQFNAQPAGARLGVAMCILGDPEYAVRPSPGHSTKPYPSPARKSLPDPAKARARSMESMASGNEGYFRALVRELAPLSYFIGDQAAHLGEFCFEDEHLLGTCPRCSSSLKLTRLNPRIEYLDDMRYGRCHLCGTTCLFSAKHEGIVQLGRLHENQIYLDGPPRRGFGVLNFVQPTDYFATPRRQPFSIEWPKEAYELATNLKLDKAELPRDAIRLNMSFSWIDGISVIDTPLHRRAVHFAA